MATSQVIHSLKLLVRVFVGPHYTVTGEIIDYGTTKAARIVYLADENALMVASLTFNRPNYADRSMFDLDDPRSVPAAIRSFCRRLGKSMPRKPTNLDVRG